MADTGRVQEILYFSNIISFPKPPFVFLQLLVLRTLLPILHLFDAIKELLFLKSISITHLNQILLWNFYNYRKNIV